MFVDETCFVKTDESVGIVEGSEVEIVCVKFIERRLAPAMFKLESGISVFVCTAEVACREGMFDDTSRPDVG